MPIAEKYNFLNRGNVVEVWAEALEDKYLRKGGDGASEVQGYEGAWRRATVIDHTKKERTNKRRFASQLASGRATPDGFLQAMYAKWKPLGKDKEPPLPHEGGQPGDQSSDSDSEEDQPADDYVPPEYFVAPLHLRPWVPFSDNSLWPQVNTEQLRVGMRDAAKHAGHAVLYVDGLDGCARWCCWVRRVFDDGVWLWVKGPEAGRPPWAQENHHVACCDRASPCWKATFGKDRPIFPLEDHLRRDQVYDLDSGRWAREDERAYFDPEWKIGGRITGQCPHVRRADQLLGDEVHKARMHAAMSAVGSAIADGALPEVLQAFVRSFDAEACITAGASGDDVQALAEMLSEPLFHETFCGFLLDSLRQGSPVSCAGVAVFEQIKVTFKRDAEALQEHMARELVRAHFL